MRRKVDREKNRDSKGEREVRAAKTARLRDQRLDGGCTEPKPVPELKAK